MTRPRRRNDRHHIVHNRLEWSSRPESSAIRETISLIPRMDRAAHDELHRNCPPIPLLGFHALQRTLSDFHPTHDTFESMDALMKSMEYASHHPKAHPIEKQMALLAIQAVDLQRPYVRAGIILPN